MNHPVLIRTNTSRRRLLHVLSFAGGIAATVLLLNPAKDPTAPAAASARVPGNTAPSPPASHAAPVTVAAPAPPPAVAIPVPVVKTTAEMNHLVDDNSLPLDSRIAGLTVAMHSSDRKVAFEAARRAVFLLKGEDYLRCTAPLLRDLSLSPAAMEVLVLNLHDRPVEQSLPLFAAVVNTPGHPFHAEAADTLKFHLQDKADATGDTLTQNIESWLQTRTGTISHR